MEKFSRTMSVFFLLFYILCENFSKIGPIIKKIPNFVNDPLKGNGLDLKKKPIEPRQGSESFCNKILTHGREDGLNPITLGAVTLSIGR